MNWVYLLVLAVGLAFANAPAHANPDRRVALIIGNDAYKSLKTLDNAVNDARAMERELKAAGFETTVRTNVGRREMNGAITDFADKLASGAVGLFYYAGHGIEAKGQNFLVPVDAVVEREADLTSEAVNAGNLVQAMKEAHNKLNIVILDACRDNPLKSRSGSRGLAVIPSGGAGLFVAYAAAPGEKADDGGKDKNGVFTGELVKALREPGLKIEDVFKKVTAGVQGRTGGRQVPYISASISGDFYFRPGSAAAPVVRNDGGAGGGNDGLFWSSIKDSRDASDFQAYLDRYPSGDFSALARTRLDKLKGAQTASLSPGAVVKPEPVLDALDREMVAGRKGSVRDAPEAKAKLISTLAEGDSIQVTGKVQGANWYAVSRKGQHGFVVADTLEEAGVYKARKDKAAQVAVLAPAQPATGGGSRSPGSVFRDCAGCPEMVVVPAGSFMMGMGASEQELFRAQGGAPISVENATPQHQVTIGYSFAVGKYEVTQGEWQSLMGLNPSKFVDGRNPVENVSWDDAQEFIRRLNAKLRGAQSVSTGGDGPYRLLTEAEWEYAARAGTTTTYSWGDSPGWGNANCDGCRSQWDGKQTAPVGSFRPNAFGLHDMHGNVQEWLQDCSLFSYKEVPSDGSAQTEGCPQRRTRGGSWSHPASSLLSASRNSYTQRAQFSIVGFRIARTLP